MGREETAKKAEVRKWTADCVVTVWYKEPVDEGDKIDHPARKWAPNPLCLEIRQEYDYLFIPWHNILQYRVTPIVSEGDSN